jgi:hypothetical protein
MNPHPAPSVPGNTEWERFDNAVRKMLKVPKEAFLKEEARLKAIREKKTRATKQSKSTQQ